MFPHVYEILRTVWRVVPLLVVLTFLIRPTGLVAASTRYLSPSGSDAGTCLNSAAPCKTFKYTIAQSLAGDTIRAAVGTYHENNIAVNKNLMLKGGSSSSTILDGSAAGRVLLVPTGVTVKLRGLAIQNGRLSDDVGAGILNHGTLTLNGVIVSRNRSVGSLSNAKGGGVFNDGTLKVLSSFIAENYADVHGGGIYNADSAILGVKNSMIVHNSAPVGGGISNVGGTITLSRVTLSGNLAPNGSGGGMYNYLHATATLSNVTLSGNSAGLFAGGMFNTGSSSATLANVAFIGNSSGRGGGFYNNGGTASLSKVTLSGNSALLDGGAIGNENATATLSNVTLSGNSAAHYGGGIYNNNATATFASVTFNANTASAGGGGIYVNSGTVKLKNTIVANSPAGGNCGGLALTTQGHNLDSGNTCGFVIAAHDQIHADPKLAPLQHNGGYTETHALVKKSPAVDAGTNSGCPATDQRGMPRPHDGDGDSTATCDIGAYEY